MGDRATCRPLQCHRRRQMKEKIFGFVAAAHSSCDLNLFGRISLWIWEGEGPKGGEGVSRTAGIVSVLSRWPFVLSLFVCRCQAVFSAAAASPCVAEWAVTLRGEGVGVATGVLLREVVGRF